MRTRDVVLDQGKYHPKIAPWQLLHQGRDTKSALDLIRHLPLPPAGNRLPVAVEAGRKTPA